MTEYLIFFVSYSKEHEHIEWVVVARPVDGKLDKYAFVHRKFVADLIDTGCASFCTATYTDNGKKFVRGAQVIVYDGDFITTVSDAKEENNLQNLPSFSMPDDEIHKAFEVMVKEHFGESD